MLHARSTSQSHFHERPSASASQKRVLDTAESALQTTEKSSSSTRFPWRKRTKLDRGTFPLTRKEREHLARRHGRQRADAERHHFRETGQRDGRARLRQRGAHALLEREIHRLPLQGVHQDAHVVDADLRTAERRVLVQWC